MDTFITLHLASTVAAGFHMDMRHIMHRLHVKSFENDLDIRQHIAAGAEHAVCEAFAMVECGENTDMKNIHIGNVHCMTDSTAYRCAELSDNKMSIDADETACIIDDGARRAADRVVRIVNALQKRDRDLMERFKKYK
jgi:hypothetical protein